MQAQNRVKLAFAQQRLQMLCIARVDRIDGGFSFAFAQERGSGREKRKPARACKRLISQRFQVRERRMLPKQHTRAEGEARVPACSKRLLQRTGNNLLPFTLGAGQDQRPHFGFPPIPM
ncbi:hypothetical protein SDC9_150294 [bioreactor metagenome]|uniref:Uncharacterized protein n=1 Tax=bioreactor metagenome TaxID=1076179 RepID=A0A645EM29_9ZZZZ